MGKELGTKSAADVVLRKGLKDAPPFLSPPASNQWAFMRLVFRGQNPLLMRVDTREAYFLTEKKEGGGLYEREITPEEELEIKAAALKVNPFLKPDDMSTGQALTFLLSMNEQLKNIESINRPQVDEGSGEVGDTLGTEDGDVLRVGVASRDTLSSDLEEVMGKILQPREIKFLSMHWGIGGEKKCTLEEIGRQHGITKERVRQIQEKALRKVRHHPSSHFLRDYVPEE